uniref:Uncharacterized protein n=1 Tax=Caenorhabditis tropicalis TaxID=1561998 RepID=A0A1I7UPP9_9PELO
MLLLDALFQTPLVESRSSREGRSIEGGEGFSTNLSSLSMINWIYLSRQKTTTLIDFDALNWTKGLAN